MSFKKQPGITTGAALFMGGIALAHADPLWQFTSGVDFSSGKYGTAERTDVWYTPFTIRYSAEPWQFKLTVPYLRVTSPGGAIIGYDENGVPIRGGGGTRSAESGLGDVVLSATYALVERTDFLLDVTGKVKFGTASVSRGLGTGEEDVALALDAFFPRGRLTPFVNVGYKNTGDPAGVDLRDTWQASLGFAYRWSDQWSGGGMFDWRAASTATSESARDLTFYAVYKLTPEFKLQGYLSKGFSNASPDYGLGLMATLNY